MARGIDAMRRHIGKSVVVKIKNEDGTYDEIELKPLKMRYFPEFWSLFESFVDIDMQKEPTAQDMVKAMNKKTIETLCNLMKTSLQETYPDAEEAMIEQFVSENFFELIDKFFEVNLPSIPESGRIVKVNSKGNRKDNVR